MQRLIASEGESVPLRQARLTLCADITAKNGKGTQRTSWLWLRSNYAVTHSSFNLTQEIPFEMAEAIKYLTLING